MTDMMKRVVIACAASFAAALFSGVQTNAAEPDPSLKFEVRIGVSLPCCSPVSNSLMTDSYGCIGSGSYSWDGKLSHMFADYDGAVYSTGTVSAEFSYIFRKWLTFSMGIGYDHYWKNIYDGLDDSLDGRADAGVLHLMPLARFTYLSHRNVKLYSGAGLGVSYYTNYNSGKTLFGELGIYGVWYPMIQTIPVGVSFGNRFFGFAELGLGTVWCGLRAGVGCRF